MSGEEPCIACSWTPEQQRRCSYKSHVCLFYGAGTHGVWSLGSQYVLKDRESNPPDYDPQNTRFLQAHTTIPVPSTLLEWDEPADNSCLRVVRRIDGITLKEAWPNLSETEKHDIAKQTCTFLAQLRNLTSNEIESLDHRPLYDALLFGGDRCTPHGPLKSDDKLWDEIVGNTGLSKLPDGVQKVLYKNMPPATPYTFTHGDLSQVNIMVKDGKLAGIIDWERSGYMPRWWEFAKTFITTEGQDDAEWKALLREYMEEHYDGARFWLACFELRSYPDLSTNGRETLAAIRVEAELAEEESAMQ